jgi:gamma-glutamyl phosphate reductase
MKNLKQIGTDAKKAFLKLKNLKSHEINKVLLKYNQLLLDNKKKFLKRTRKM